MKDKLEQHHGLQLSALMDGELAPDEARFLLRRLQHDGELADRWERWQLAGEALRGRAGALLPGGFAGRVATALHAETPAPARRAPGLLRWGGVAALAASVAVVALMVPRPAPDAGGVEEGRIAASGSLRPVEPEAAAVAAVSPAVVGAPAAETPPAQAPVVEMPAAGARILASNEGPANDRPVRATRDQGPSSAAATSPVREVVAAPPASPPQQLASQVAASPDPFSDAPLAARPWPRAVLPQYGNGGALATGLPDDHGSQPPSFYPFEPRLPQQVPEPTPGPGVDASPPAPY